MTHITVLEYTTGLVIYSGPSESVAAQALEPGTCFGKGDCRAQATSQALERAAAARRAG